ncbi:Transcriptional regulator, LacI family (HTH and periplasmic-binding domains) [Alkalihalophilus pseudofirmus OF4]|uniref:Transcriptional regulator, LacI family (HTH and periplasmic-binding domains) n=1 Tax=Alkalihalophilus pseudofirmus (strain ATCC BAA-2126 / JCM 17055 / OF4) TaxID=398511 RepID=D3G056_ALKPO|nr:LacI family DNA-binding transcriptional regulator [Alkalihalophilus pseudofirmus]ADC49331.1 Transcriptional regulator, LacI family (HTH and periplasmic-binding domains) [Alkalihalophilus pseudofirmus OF4]
MTTIREVAKMAGVSVATVSRVINGNGKVKQATEEKVREIIKELNYVPSAIAVSLNNKKSKTIGLMLPDITNPFFAELAKGVEEVAKENGYTVILCNTNGDLQSELDHLQVLEQKYVDGIILSSHTLSYSDVEHIATPIVSIDRTLEGNFPSVTSNNFQGAVMAVRHLLEKGCKKIAHISGPQSIRTARLRLQGYLEVVGDLDWYTEALVADGDYEIKSGYEATRTLLQMNRDIDGIFAGNDLMAVGCLKAIHSLGLHVPRDISVIGFDGINFSKITIPELSTISQPIYDMGLLATNTLLKAMEGQCYEQMVYELDVQLIERDSTK